MASPLGHLPPPADEFVGLGVLFNLAKNTASLPAKKVSKTKKLIDLWMEKTDDDSSHNDSSHDNSSHDDSSHDDSSHDDSSHDTSSHDGSLHDISSHDDSSHNDSSQDDSSHDDSSHNDSSHDISSLDDSSHGVSSHDDSLHDDSSLDDSSHDDSSHDSSHDISSHDDSSHDISSHDDSSHNDSSHDISSHDDSSHDICSHDISTYGPLDLIVKGIDRGFTEPSKTRLPISVQILSNLVYGLNSYISHVNLEAKSFGLAMKSLYLTLFSAMLSGSWLILTKAVAGKMLSSQLTAMGLDSKLYGLHSFRVGSIMQGLEGNNSMAFLRLHSDHRSSAIYGYLHLPAVRRFGVACSLSRDIASAALAIGLN